MKLAIRYYTRSGNTKKLALAMEEALGVSAKDISEPLTEYADILFLGNSYYAFDAEDSVKQYIQDNKGYIHKVVCFGTSALLGSTRKHLQSVCDNCGIILENKAFHCFGEFGPMHKGRPNTQDLLHAQEFAQSVIQSCDQ